MEQPVQDVHIVVHKGERRLSLYSGDSELASFPIGLGSSPAGHKQREGNGKTPEGLYYVCMRNDKSRFHLSLGLSYPNAQDAGAALDKGLIDKDTLDRIVNAIDKKEIPPWDTPLGGEIMIHGGGSGDWTAGCIAVEDTAMDFLWLHVPLGTPVTILP